MINMYAIGTDLRANAWSRIREYCNNNGVTRYWLDSYDKAKHGTNNWKHHEHFIIMVECFDSDLMQIKLLVNDDILYITDMATISNVTISNEVTSNEDMYK